MINGNSIVIIMVSQVPDEGRHRAEVELWPNYTLLYSTILYYTMI